jgi:hypothetical protein
VKEAESSIFLLAALPLAQAVSTSPAPKQAAINNQH